MIIQAQKNTAKQRMHTDPFAVPLTLVVPSDVIGVHSTIGLKDGRKNQ